MHAGSCGIARSQRSCCWSAHLLPGWPGLCCWWACCCLPQAARGSGRRPATAPLFKLLLPPILGVRPADLRPVDRIGEVRAPVLVAAGTTDDRTTLAESQDLFAHVSTLGTFWPVPGAGHEDLQRFDPVGYQRVVLAFLEQHLRQAPQVR